MFPARAPRLTRNSILILVMEYVYFSILSVLLAIRSTFACDLNSECRPRCCKRTDGRGELVKGVCISRETCDGFCVVKDDCLAPQICDTSVNLCTTKCLNDIDCHPSHICKKNHCAEDESFFATRSTIFVVIGLSIVFTLCCCCLRLQWQRVQRGDGRRSRDQNTTTNATFRNTSEGYEQQSGNVGTLELNSAAGESYNPDAVVSSGPPSYREVTEVPEEPPPSYEEAIRSSTENLSEGTEAQQV